MTIKVGDVVYLNSDKATKMTVESIDDDGWAECVWRPQKAGEIKRGKFDLRMLSHADGSIPSNFGSV